MLAVFGSMVPKKKLQCIPQEIQENASTEWTCYLIPETVARDTYPLFLCVFFGTLAAVNIGYDKCPILETC